MGFAKMPITVELLKGMFELPESTVIVDAWVDWEVPSNPSLVLVVGHPDIRTVTVHPSLVRHIADCGHTERVEFKGWN